MAQIPLKESDKITIPAKTTPQVVADVMWVLQVVARFPGPTHEGSFTLEYCAMTADGVLIQRDVNLNDLTKRMETQEFFADTLKCPELLAIQTAIIDNTPGVQVYLDKKAKDKADAEKAAVTPVVPK